MRVVSHLNHIKDLHSQVCFAREIMFCSLTREIDGKYTSKVQVTVVYYVFQACAVNLVATCVDSVAFTLSSSSHFQIY